MKKTLLAATLVALGLVFSFLVVPALSYAVNNSCTRVRDMPTSRAYLQAVAVNGRIYALGGSTLGDIDARSNEVILGANEEYDPATNMWQTKTAMPTPLKDFAAVVVENKIYCIFGEVNEVYDPATDSWQTKTAMPVASGYQATAQVVDGKIYVFIAAPERNLNEMYDPTTDTWTIKTPMPPCTINYRLTSAAVDGKIYLFTNQTQIYDPKTDTWTTAASIPRPQQYQIAAATTGIYAEKAIYIFGGRNTTNPISTASSVWTYFPADNSWSDDAVQLSITRMAFGVAVIADNFFLVGGAHNVFFTQLNWTEKYVPLSYSSANIDSSAEPIPETTTVPEPTYQQDIHPKVEPTPQQTTTPPVTALSTPQTAYSASASPNSISSPTLPELPVALTLIVLFAITGIVVGLVLLSLKAKKHAIP